MKFAKSEAKSEVENKIKSKAKSEAEMIYSFDIKLEFDNNNIDE